MTLPSSSFSFWNALVAFPTPDKVHDVSPPFHHIHEGREGWLNEKCHDTFSNRM